MEYRKGKKSIRSVARENGKSESEVRRDMQEAIDAAWASNDLESLRLQQSLFPNGKPTPEEFIEKLSEHVKRQSS